MPPCWILPEISRYVQELQPGLCGNDPRVVRWWKKEGKTRRQTPYSGTCLLMRLIESHGCLESCLYVRLVVVRKIRHDQRRYTIPYHKVSYSMNLHMAVGACTCVKPTLSQNLTPMQLNPLQGAISWCLVWVCAWERSPVYPVALLSTCFGKLPLYFFVVKNWVTSNWSLQSQAQAGWGYHLSDDSHRCWSMAVDDHFPSHDILLESKWCKCETKVRLHWGVYVSTKSLVNMFRILMIRFWCGNHMHIYFEIRKSLPDGQIVM